MTAAFVIKPKVGYDECIRSGLALYGKKMELCEAYVRKKILSFSFSLFQALSPSFNEKGRKNLQCSFSVSFTCNWYLSKQVLQYASRHFSSTNLESTEGGTKAQDEDVKQKCGRNEGS